MRAIISVYYKEGVEKIGRVLAELGYEIVSSGGTYTYLTSKGIPAVKVSDITNFPEILDGRVKTLHPAIHGGILAREKDIPLIKNMNIEPVDFVVVNLYPFEEKMKDELPEEELIEFIDIGGPALIRASAKNFHRVTVVTDPSDYDWVAEKIKSQSLTLKDRAYLAYKAFSLTAYYDSLIAEKIRAMYDIEESSSYLTLPMKKRKMLRYGENPHQKGILYEDPFEDIGIAKVSVLQGKEMSFNNYLDADSAVKIVSELSGKSCVIVKHNNPCGAATASTVVDAFRKARDSDPESAFGGIVAFNDTVDVETAEELTSMFLEVIVAPEYEESALQILSKKKNMRVLKYEGLQRSYDIKKISGGYLLQDEDVKLFDEWRVVTQKEPSEEEKEDLLFAWKVCKYVKSNAIVIAKGRQTLGIGSGNVSRVASLKCAVEKALQFGHDLKGAVVASDGFFPFRDSIDFAAKHGISSVIQPGGSIRDEEIIRVCNEHYISMVFTGTRHFRH